MENIIIKYLEGSASDEEKYLLLNWMDENEAHQKEFSEIRDLWITAGNVLSGHFDSMNAFELFKQHVVDYEKTKQRKIRRLQVLKYVASVAILIGCSLGMYLLGHRNQGDTDAEIILNNFAVRNDKSALVLPDGTRVWLNNDSKLSYPEHFSGWQRVVKLEGEGYFEVFHDETNPFFVETNGFAVKVLGTVFDVRNYPNDAIPEVVLLSGRIEVDIKKGSESVQLLPNQKMSYNKQTGNYDIASIDAPEYALWKNDKLVMDNEELETIFRKIGRWYNVDIVYDKNLPLTSRHTITITSEAKEEILRLLSITMPIKYQIENDKVIIKRK